MSDEPITADDLHRHIQAAIFGRYEPHGRFDALQAKLHELVDAMHARDYKPPKLTCYGTVAEMTKEVGNIGQDGIIGSRAAI